MSIFQAFTSLSETVITLPAGGVLFRTGDAVRSLFLVGSGAVRLVRVLPNGATLTLQLAGPGAILAEASLFADRYHCDAVAVADSEVRGIARKRAARAVTENPELARLWAMHLASEIQRARTQVEIVSLKTVAERVDAWLALRGALPAKGHWHRVASEIGVTPEALYRELARRRRA